MKIALVGNQNSGKTTLFNLLTGTNQKIGNWPGVTIERKEGFIRGTDLEIVDLPGVYSLSPYTAEEEVSRKYIFEEQPDLIINIVDATSIERSLYLTTQLLELDCGVIIALNMSDRLAKKGLNIDVAKLSGELGVTVMPISALKKTGIEELIDRIKKNDYLPNARKRIYPKDIETEISAIEKDLSTSHKRFVAVKLLENDANIRQVVKNGIAGASRKSVEAAYGADGEQIIANERYNYIVSVRKACVTKAPKQSDWTERLDKIFLNRWAAIPIFAVIMIAIYFLSVGVIGGLTVDWVDGLIGGFSDWLGGVLEGWGASGWSVSLLIDGVIAGAGAMMTFVPQLIILFLCISLLETTGYMSRIAFVLDKLFKKIGLSGKSLIPFIVGSGCSVPGIMASRTVEDHDEHLMTTVLTPFVPCSAKLPIIALFAGAFFPDSAGLISVSLYFFSIAVIIISAVLMKKFLFKRQTTSFISELPDYLAPSVRYVARDVGSKTWSFIKRAGTIIVLCSVVIWFLGSFSWTFEYGIDVNESMLAGIGNGFAWLFYPMLGEWSWAASVSAIQGLIAKEQVVSSMEVIAGLAEGAGGAVFGTSVFSFFTGASAYAFMVFNLFSAPCVAAIGAMRRELGSGKRTLYAVLFQTGLAFILAYIVFGIGVLFGG